MTRSWWDADRILKQFRDWLTGTGAELDALEAETEIASRNQPAEPLPEIGLLQMAETLGALRHELKLETRSTRGLQKSVYQALEGLASATQKFDSTPAREQEAAEFAAASLVEALIGIDEALQRGASAFARTQERMATGTAGRLRDAFEDEFYRLPWWRRMLAQHWHRQVLWQCDRAPAENAEDFRSLREGYEMIRSRMERVLAQHGISRIRCVGRKLDPAQMTAVELVDDPAAEPETVVEEVRPGYVWNERVIRFAEVRAVRSRAAGTFERSASGSRPALRVDEAGASSTPIHDRRLFSSSSPHAPSARPNDFTRHDD